jgi:hypothetical protein
VLFDLSRRQAATFGNLPSGNGVVKLQEHLAEIKDDDGGFHANDELRNPNDEIMAKPDDETT